MDRQTLSQKSRNNDAYLRVWDGTTVDLGSISDIPDDTESLVTCPWTATAIHAEIPSDLTSIETITMGITMGITETITETVVVTLDPATPADIAAVMTEPIVVRGLVVSKREGRCDVYVTETTTMVTKLADATTELITLTTTYIIVGTNTVTETIFVYNHDAVSTS